MEKVVSFSFRKNGTITLYYRMYMRTCVVCVDHVGAPAYVGTHALYLRCVHTYTGMSIQGPAVTTVVCAWPMSGCYEL